MTGLDEYGRIRSGVTHGLIGTLPLPLELDRALCRYVAASADRTKAGVLRLALAEYLGRVAGERET